MRPDREKESIFLGIHGDQIFVPFFSPVAIDSGAINSLLERVGFVLSLATTPGARGSVAAETVKDDE